MLVGRQGSLQTIMSCHDGPRCEDELTDDPVTILGDVILYGLFPAQGLLFADVNINVA